MDSLSRAGVQEAAPHIFYVDVENTSAHGFDGIYKLRECDTVVPVYTDHSCKLNFDRIAELLLCDATVLPCRVKDGGKNYCDFQLITMAVLNAQLSGEGVMHVVVSQDGGYDLAIDMARTLGLANVARRERLCYVTVGDTSAVERVRYVSNKAVKATSIAADVAESVRKQQRTVNVITSQSSGASVNPKLVGCLRKARVAAKDVSIVETCLRQAHGDKLAFNNALVKSLGTRRGGEVYRLVRPVFERAAKLV